MVAKEATDGDKFVAALQPSGGDTFNRDAGILIDVPETVQTYAADGIEEYSRFTVRVNIRWLQGSGILVSIDGFCGHHPSRLPFVIGKECESRIRTAGDRARLPMHGVDLMVSME